MVKQGASVPLPSWNNGLVKASIIKFIIEVPTKGCPIFGYCRVLKVDEPLQLGYHERKVRFYPFGSGINLGTIG